MNSELIKRYSRIFTVGVIRRCVVIFWAIEGDGSLIRPFSSLVEDLSLGQTNHYEEPLKGSATSKLFSCSRRFLANT